MIYTIHLEQSQVQLIANALAALPYGQVAALISKLQADIQKQEQDYAATAQTAADLHP